MKLSDTRSDMHVIFVGNLTQNAKNSGEIFYIRDRAIFTKRQGRWKTGQGKNFFQSP
jgi:hypothetical protein